MSENDQLTRNISVPAWMVWLFSTLGVVAAATLGGVIVTDRSQVHQLGNRQSELTERVSRMEEKTKDILDALNGIRGDIKELGRMMP